MAVIPTYGPVMSLNGGGLCTVETVEVELFPPPLPPHLRTQIQWRYPLLALSLTGG
jgi:hypothetical protein